MSEFISVDQMWNNLKNDETAKLVIESSEKTIEIIQKLINERRRLGLSQRELAEKCGMKQSALARIETFSVTPQINTLIKIAKVVGVIIVAYTEEEQAAWKAETDTAYFNGILVASNFVSQYQKELGKYHYKYNEGVKYASKH